MSRNAPIYFMRVGKTKTGRGLYKLSNGAGKPFGRAFCIGPRRRAPKPPTAGEKETTDGR